MFAFLRDGEGERGAVAARRAGLARLRPPRFASLSRARPRAGASARRSRSRPIPSCTAAGSTRCSPACCCSRRGRCSRSSGAGGCSARPARSRRCSARWSSGSCTRTSTARWSAAARWSRRWSPPRSCASGSGMSTSRGWLAPVAALELRVPSWGLAVAWAVYQAVIVWAARGDLPGGLQNAQGLTASLGAAAAGAGIAVALRAPRPGSTASAPRLEALAPRTASGRFDIEKVKRARAKGDLETAFQMLRAETRRSARNRDVVLLFWEIAVEHDQAEAAAPAMLQLIREELRRGALDAAVSQWRRLGERVPGALLEPAVLLKLLPLIRSKLGDDAAVLALHQAADPANRGFTPELGAQIAREAAAIEPEVARQGRRPARSRRRAIAPELASELNALVARLQPRERATTRWGSCRRCPRSSSTTTTITIAATSAPSTISRPIPLRSETAAAAPPRRDGGAGRCRAGRRGADRRGAGAAVGGGGERAPAACFPSARIAQRGAALARRGGARWSTSRARASRASPTAASRRCRSRPCAGSAPSRWCCSICCSRARSRAPSRSRSCACAATSSTPASWSRRRRARWKRCSRSSSRCSSARAASALPDDAAGRGRPLRMFDSLDAYSGEVLRIAAG